MNGNYTLSIIKPHAVKENKTVAILEMIDKAGFRISAMKMVRMSKEQTGLFYAEHTGKEFYVPLVEMMSSGPVVVVLLEKENAVSCLRKLVGNTDPLKAEPGTLRHIFGISTRENAIHASDGDQNALRERDFFFADNERF